MPTDPKLLGFGNEWYRLALVAAMPAGLPSGRTIRLVTPAYFLATKLAAFDGRGAGDYLASHDMEDIVAVLDGRPSIVDDVLHADSTLRAHLASRFSMLLSDRRFVEALSAHLPPDTANQQRARLLLGRVEALGRIE